MVDHSQTDPLRDAITSSRIRAISLAPDTTPNKIYTFLPIIPLLLRLRRAVEQYIREEGAYPSMLRVSPQSYLQVAPELGRSPDRADQDAYLHYCLYLDRDTLAHFPVDSYTKLRECEVECVGARKTGPMLAVMMEQPEPEQEIA